MSSAVTSILRLVKTVDYTARYHDCISIGLRLDKKAGKPPVLLMFVALSEQHKKIELG